MCGERERESFTLGGGVGVSAEGALAWFAEWFGLDFVEARLPESNPLELDLR